MGVLLPIVLIVVDLALLGESCLRVRDSLSAYYHSGARDIFVIGLGIVGFLLASYKITRRSLANGLSLVAGLAAITVAIFPTRLPDTVECGSGEPTPTLAPLQIALGEEPTGIVHHSAAAVVFTMFVSLCVNTALHDRRFQMERDADGSVGPNSWWWSKPRKALAWISNHIRWWFHLACGVIIVVVGVVYLVVSSADGTFPGNLGPLWVAEVVGILFFSASWFAKGLDDMFWRREPWSRASASEMRLEALEALEARAQPKVDQTQNRRIIG
ncbi:MAG TPA: hypothetical protein VIW24_10990 [Aldersonia sp.]